MKKTALILTLLLAAAAAGRPGSVAAQPAADELRGSLSLSGAWALYPLALKWAEEFQKLHPGVRVDVQAGGAGKGIADVLAGSVDIGMVSRDINPAETDKGALAVAVAKDAVVATLNRRNPRLADILRRGLKKEEFAAIWITKAVTSWEELLGLPGKTPIRVYTRSDACGAAETWATYLGKRQEDLTGVGVYGDPGVAEAVRRDVLGIGFNNINFAYDAKTKRPVDGIEICPIDLDGNGRLDPGEQVYATRDDIVKAIAGNIYPSPPARELYFVLKGKPKSALLAEFLTWVLTSGQAYAPEMGYLQIPKERAARGLAAIGGTAAGK
ncbi:MAG: PstS family phosphate ABC transporter substrate-binding protein [Candidatus Aminicenantales bacterium]